MIELARGEDVGLFYTDDSQTKYDSHNADTEMVVKFG